MKKIKLIDLIRSNLPKPDKTNRYHPSVVEHHVSASYNELLVKTYTKELYDLGLFTKRYGDNGTPVAVLRNTDTKEYYSVLPEEIVPLPDLNAGVREILPLEGRSIVFVPMRYDELKLIEGLEVQQIDDAVGFTVHGNNVIYTGMTTAIASAGVVMSLIIPFHAYDDEDTVYFPKGMEDTIIRSVLEKLGIIPPVDLVNNNSNITEKR